MIFDCHCHAGFGESLACPWNTTVPLERYLNERLVAASRQCCTFNDSLLWHSARNMTMNYDELFEILPLNHQTELESGRSRSRPIVLPMLTIRDQPFVGLDRFAFHASAMPVIHNPIIEHITRLAPPQGGWPEPP